MKRKITELIIILFFYLMQVSVARVISIANISPNWLIILPVFFGFFCGKNDGMFAGFFAGIMYDLFYSGLFGFTALIFIYIFFRLFLSEVRRERNSYPSCTCDNC